MDSWGVDSGKQPPISVGMHCIMVFWVGWRGGTSCFGGMEWIRGRMDGRDGVGNVFGGHWGDAG